jgi:type 1 fimbriae regulatory protein FimB/type 1 fimbriae regulatory protein FimE
MEKLMTAAMGGRYGQRDRTLLLIMYRHGLRVGEAINLRWEQIDLKAGLLAVQRLKNGVASTHPVWPASITSSAGDNYSCWS